ncbi:hypothetical protein JCM11251_002567 [Rhodosporidiobolus azoricus]
MGGLIAVLEYLPIVRKAFLGVLMVAGGADLMATIILLAYQLAMTHGYQHTVPAITATSFLCTVFPVWFLFSRPYSIKLPVGSSTLSTDPRVGSVRDKIAKFSRSIAAEVVCLGGSGVWVLIAVSNLHAETPGLINHCGGWAICRMLMAVFALTWICFLFLGLAFASLLLSTLYFTLRRSSPLPLLSTSFNAVDWERYAGRPVNRANTVKLPRRNKAEKERERARESSIVPVLPQHNGLGASVLSTSNSVSSGLDWDVQSTMTAPTIPYGRSSESRPSSVVTANGVGMEMGLAEMAEQEKQREETERKLAQGAKGEESVFVLIEDDEEEKDKKTGGVGAAL